MRVKKFTFPLYLIRNVKYSRCLPTRVLPRAYLFGKDGKLIYTSTGYTPEEFQKLMDTIEEALK